MTDNEADIWAKIEAGDKEARDQMILNSMYMVDIASKRTMQKLPQYIEYDDIYSHGTIGLLDAVSKFRYEKGYQFGTYAIQRIRGAILDGLRKMDWVPRNVRIQAKKLNEVNSTLFARLGRNPTEDELCAELGWDIELLRTVEQQHMSTIVPHSMSHTWHLDHADVVDSPYDVIGETLSNDEIDLFSRYEMDEIKERLAKAMEELPDRERAIAYFYYYEQVRFSDIAAMFNVSESRICQLHVKAIGTIRNKLVEVDT